MCVCVCAAYNKYRRRCSVTTAGPIWDVNKLEKEKEKELNMNLLAEERSITVFFYPYTLTEEEVN